MEDRPLPESQEVDDVDAYDVFASYPHKDKQAVRRIVKALEERGLRVWWDEKRIQEFSSISNAVQTGLGRSKVLLAYYSKAYLQSRACQWELTAAFVATEAVRGQARIVVANPERSRAHIHPVHLRDSLSTFNAPGSDENLESFCKAVTNQVQSLDSTFGSLCELASPRWYGAQPISATRFLGRLDSLWQIHSALTAHELPLSTKARPPGVAEIRSIVVYGVPI